MKVTVILTEAEVKGLLAYLSEADGIKASKKDIAVHVQNIVSGTINAPQEASSHYIQQIQG